MTTAPLPDANPRLEREAAARVGCLFDRHGRMVYGVCRAMLRDVHEAEDATQQVFLSAHKALLGGARVREPGGWLATIARNECRGRIATGMRTPLPVSDDDLAALPAPVDEHARQAQVREIRDALEALPARQREAVVLRHLYGLRYGEVATALGLSRSATEALLFRARRALRGRLQPAAGAALVVPLALRDELALALPGFSAGAGTSAAAVGAASGGVLAKLVAGSAGVKVATAAVAVSTVGAVGAVESDRPVQSDQARPAIVETSSGQSAASDGAGTASDDSDDDATVNNDDDGEGPGGSGNGGDGDRTVSSSRGSDGDSPASGEDSGHSASGDDSDHNGSRDETDDDEKTADSSGSGSSGGSGDDKHSDGESSGSGSSGSGSSGSGSDDGGDSGSDSGSSGSGSDDPPEDEES